MRVKKTPVREAANFPRLRIGTAALSADKLSEQQTQEDMAEQSLRSGADIGDGCWIVVNEQLHL